MRREGTAMLIFANLSTFGELAHSVWNITKQSKTCLYLVNLHAFGELAHSVWNTTKEHFYHGFEQHYFHVTTFAPMITT